MIEQEIVERTYETTVQQRSSPKFPVKAQGVEHPLLAHIKQRPLEQRIALPSQLATAGVA